MIEITDEIVVAAKKADRDGYVAMPIAHPYRPPSWSTVPDDQVRRLISGALGYIANMFREQH